DRTYIDELEFVFNLAPEQMLEGVLSGAYAYTKSIPRERLPELLASPQHRAQMQAITQPHCQYLLVNPSEGHLTDARIRRAISHAIDRRQVVERYSRAPIAVVAEGL